MNEIRCGECRRKLGEGEYTRLTIKCPRCGVMNQLSAASATPARRLSVIPKGKDDERRFDASKIHPA